MHKLLRAGQPWRWSKDCEQAFQQAKENLIKAPILAHYDPDLPIVLAGDASNYGLGAVISHVMPDGSEQPVAFASRTLTNSEKNYSQVEKEALSLIFGIKHFHHYLYGQHFEILTEHQPLVTILGPKQGIPPLAAARLQRWALLLSAYTYTIKFRPTKAHANADGLSRLPITVKQPEVGPDEASIFNVRQLDTLPVHASEVADATRKDVILSRVLRCLKQGWPVTLPAALLPFGRKKNELTIEGGCILWGMRVVVPSKLQNKVLDELHQGHQGAAKMKGLARNYVWWPGIDQALEKVAQKCVSCQEHKSLPPKVPLHPWSWPSAPWERIHVDFCGPIDGKMLFVVVDAYSKWPEIYPLSSTTTSKTITILRELFARYGIPRQLVSDNGSQFTSDEFNQFISSNGIRHIHTSPYHPSSNGAAERMVQTVKRAINSSKQEGLSLEYTLANYY